VAADWFCSPERVQREAAGLRVLAELTPQGTIPRLVFEDRENHLFAMEAVPEPHENWKQMLLAGKLVEDHVLQFARLLASIHLGAVEWPALETDFGDLTFFEALRLEPYYAYTAVQMPEVARFYDCLIKDTLATRLTLVHGDYSPKNVLVHRGSLVLLDHEVIHFGDPAFDLGFAVTHFLSKAHHLEQHRSSFLAAALLFWETYRNSVDLRWCSEGLEARTIRHTLGCLLARVAGRSPLEYLSQSTRKRQKQIVIAMLKSLPKRMVELMETFAGKLMKYG
jgi:aminoglycoside phosphotransferase (APT) family kinase protein